jgi:hypothetical protein
MEPRRLPPRSAQFPAPSPAATRTTQRNTILPRAQTRARSTRTMDRQYTKFQQKAIKNFYDNRESISLQRLGELVTDLYLAEGKSRATKWKQIATALERSGVPKTEIDHLLKKDDVSLLAKKVTELTGK